MDSPRLAYSYIRFSSESQRLGDSLRRQLALAEDYAARNALLLDTHTYRDLGVSAFRGRNAVEGKLALFLRAVDAGLVPTDAILLVESLDRLTRDDIDDALELFLSIIRRGLTIVTLGDGQEYCKATIKRDHGISLIVSITVMMRAHEESVTRGARIHASWQARAARGDILTTRCPSWLRWGTGKWLVDEDRADLVRWIFATYLEGFGNVSICRLLNELNIPTLQDAKFWSPGIITSLLGSKAVFGTMGRENCHEPPIEGYYPAIIPFQIFEKVRLISKSRSGMNRFHGRGTPCNFVGRSYCSNCGELMRVVSSKGESYTLQCSRAYCTTDCPALAVCGSAIDSALMAHLAAPDPAFQELTPSAKKNRAQTRRLESEILVKRGVRANLLARLMRQGDEARLSQREKLKRADDEIDQLHQEVVRAYCTSLPMDRELAEARQLIGGIRNTDTTRSDRIELRRRMRALLPKIFARIAFDGLRPMMSVVYVNGPSVDIHIPRTGAKVATTRATRRVLLA